MFKAATSYPFRRLPIRKWIANNTLLKAGAVCSTVVLLSSLALQAFGEARAKGTWFDFFVEIVGQPLVIYTCWLIAHRSYSDLHTAYKASFSPATDSEIGLFLRELDSDREAALREWEEQ